MKRAVKGLDHVVVMVDGIDAAEAAYRRLGFQVQPRGFHQKLGTANHLMIFWVSSSRPSSTPSAANG
jgi:hypothetical protein